MEIKSIEQIKDEVAKADNFHNWQLLFESCAMYDYGRLEKAIDEVATRYAQQFQEQSPTDVLTTEIMVLRERNAEMLEMLESTKDLLDAYPSESEMHLKAVEIRELITKAKEV